MHAVERVSGGRRGQPANEAGIRLSLGRADLPRILGQTASDLCGNGEQRHKLNIASIGFVQHLHQALQ